MRTWAQMAAGAPLPIHVLPPTSFLQQSTATSDTDTTAAKPKVAKSLTAQSQSSSMTLRYKSYTNKGRLHTPSNVSMMHCPNQEIA